MSVKRTYYRNGNLYTRIGYNALGQKHGIDAMFFEDCPGILLWETPYVNGKRHGVEYEYDRAGNIKYKAYYLFNTSVAAEEYKRHVLIEQLSGL